MSEIKSTLDLVMERTRNLSLSAEEKENQKKADFEKRLQGLFQKYADKFETVETIQERLSALQAESGVTDAHVVLAALFKRIHPDRDNQCWLELLDRIAPDARDPVQEALAEYEKQRADLMEASGRRLLDQLAHHHDIYGSTVIPNPQQESGYQEEVNALRQETQTRIDAILRQSDTSQ